MLELKNISKTYKNARKKDFEAIKNISFYINKKETVGLIGDSGSGKTTIGQIITGLIMPSKGEMVFENVPLKYPVKRETRRKIQILFQHPEISFNPKLHIIESLKEPYRIYLKEKGTEKIIRDIKELGLREEHLYRYPRELSGGELQRLALARILSITPQLIVLDEPTGMLDSVSQAQIIHLLKEYQNTHQSSYLFISHDKILAEQFCDRLLYINEGRLDCE